MLGINNLGFKTSFWSFKWCVFVKGESTFSIRASAVAHYTPVVASCGIDELISLAKWQFHLLFTHNSISSDRLGSVWVLFVRWDFLTFDPGEEYHKRSMPSFHKRYGSSELPQGDAWSQECADFRCGEWQPWWLSNRYSVVIETMFHSAGETAKGQWTTAKVTANN